MPSDNDEKFPLFSLEEICLWGVQVEGAPSNKIKFSSSYKPCIDHFITNYDPKHKLDIQYTWGGEYLNLSSSSCHEQAPRLRQLVELIH